MNIHFSTRLNEDQWKGEHYLDWSDPFKWAKNHLKTLMMMKVRNGKKDWTRWNDEEEEEEKKVIFVLLGKWREQTFNGKNNGKTNYVDRYVKATGFAGREMKMRMIILWMSKY